MRGLAFLIALLLALPAMASERLTGEQIKQAFTGNTVSGRYTGGGFFTGNVISLEAAGNYPSEIGEVGAGGGIPQGGTCRWMMATCVWALPIISVGRLR